MQAVVAVIVSEVFLRRLAPALVPFVREGHDYRVIDIGRPLRELIDLVQELGPDALVIEAIPETRAALMNLRIPTVLLATDMVYPGAISIDVDDAAVGALAGETLIENGHTHFAFFGNKTEYSEQRMDAFQKSVGGGAHTYLEPNFEEGRYVECFAKPDTKLESWLRDLPKPIGIFAVHDPLGRFLCMACKQIGIPVPEAISVIGANNDELICGLTVPMLASISIPWAVIGESVGKAVAEVIAASPFAGRLQRIPPSGFERRHSADFLAVDDPALRRAVHYMSIHSGEPINVESVCLALRISRRQLERKFREYYKCSPKTMLDDMRIKRAKQLLVSTSEPITRIAERCGFGDGERLSVTFRSRVGCAPSAYRRVSRSG